LTIFKLPLTIILLAHFCDFWIFILFLIFTKAKYMSSIERWTGELKSPDPEIRQAAIAKLGDSNDPAAVEPLLEALDDKVWYIQGSAAQALTRLYVQSAEVRAEGAERLTTPIAKLLKSKEAGVRKTVVAALGYMGVPESLPLLTGALDDKSESVRMTAAEALGRLGNPDAIKPLISALGDKDEWVRMSAATSLGQLNAQDAIKPLILALGDPVDNVREMAATSLGQLRAQEAVKPLIGLLEDESPEVRFKAAQALALLEASEAVPALEKMAKNDSDIAYDQPLKNVASRIIKIVKKA
jgi:HEAT repeat protein